ncbi:MAG: Holliday junction branch migration protein RuvA [Candidatus Obscuribacterales bacterium]|nr:Holliday junction branch migration protein RuvA [Candidatus Obscuribacterales bacterium]
MFAFLKGVIHSKDLSGGAVNRLVLDVSGVGFEIWMATRNLLGIGQPGEEAIVHTLMAVRETEITIFGFETADERQLCQILQTVSGVGPKLALAIVGTLGVKLVVDAVLSEDTKTISQTPGVGPKVAQRIILELQTKMEEFSSRLGSPLDPVKVSGAIQEEVRGILTNLGYTVTEVTMALKKAQLEETVGEDVESLVRYSLKVLGASALS